ncbi:Conserved_hypothetical protein [Hexamita inflata]|uniref:Uncharacterized protein n=1 Tax=Hexamita inflata TaxID=28002 RepID=A0AA86QL14_9EUKA|nr:Conserved hypothetical protein [Hexamita inflata]
MFNKNDNFAQQDQTLSIPDLTRKLNKSEPTEIQIQAVVQLRGQVLKTNLQSILDSSMNLKLDSDAEDELSMQLVDEKVKLYLKMLKLTAIPFQIEQINALFIDSLLCKELTMAITFTSLQFISEFVDKTQSISKQHLQVLLKNYKILAQLAGQHYYGFSEHLVSKQKVMQIAKNNSNNNSDTVIVISGSRYSISNEVLKQGPKAQIIKLLRKLINLVQNNYASLVQRLFAILNETVQSTTSYYNEYFQDIEEIIQLVLTQRGKTLEVQSGTNTVYLPPLDQSILDKFKQQLSPLLIFDKLRYQFVSEFNQYNLYFFQNTVVQPNFYKQFDFDIESDKILNDSIEFKNQQQQQNNIIRSLQQQIEKSRDCGGILYSVYRESKVLRAQSFLEYFQISKKFAKEYELNKQLSQGYLQFLQVLPTHMQLFDFDFDLVQQSYDSQQQYQFDFVKFIMPFTRWPLNFTHEQNSSLVQYITKLSKEARFGHFAYEQQDDYKNQFLTMMKIFLTVLRITFQLQNYNLLSAENAKLIRINVPNVNNLIELKSLIQKTDVEIFEQFIAEYEANYKKCFECKAGMNVGQNYVFLNQFNKQQNMVNGVVSVLALNNQLMEENKVMTKPNEMIVNTEYLMQLFMIDKIPVLKQYQENLQAMSLISQNKQYEIIFQALVDKEVIAKASKTTINSLNLSENEIELSQQVMQISKFSDDLVNAVISKKKAINQFAYLFFICCQLAMNPDSQTLNAELNIMQCQLCADFIQCQSELMQENMKKSLRLSTKYQQILRYKSTMKQISEFSLFYSFYASVMNYFELDNQMCLDVLSYKILKPVESESQVMSRFKYYNLIGKQDQQMLNYYFMFLRSFYERDVIAGYDLYQQAAVFLNMQVLDFQEFSKNLKLLQKQIKQFYLEDQLISESVLSTQLNTVLNSRVNIQLKRYLKFSPLLRVPFKLLVLSTYQGQVQCSDDAVLFKALTFIRSQYDTVVEFYTSFVSNSDLQQDESENTNIVLELNCTSDKFSLKCNKSALKSNNTSYLFKPQFEENLFESLYTAQIQNIQTLSEFGISEKAQYFPLHGNQFFDFFLPFVQKSFTEDTQFQLFGQQSATIVDLQFGQIYKNYYGQELNLNGELNQKTKVNLIQNEAQYVFDALFDKKLEMRFFPLQLSVYQINQLYLTIYNLEKVTYTTETLQLILYIYRIAPTLAEKLIEVKDLHDLPGSIFRYCLLFEVSFASVFLNLFQIVETLDEAQFTQLLLIISYCNSKNALINDKQILKELVKCDSVEAFNILKTKFVQMTGDKSSDQRKIECCVGRKQTASLILALEKGPKVQAQRAYLCGFGW